MQPPTLKLNSKSLRESCTTPEDKSVKPTTPNPSFTGQKEWVDVCPAGGIKYDEVFRKIDIEDQFKVAHSLELAAKAKVMGKPGLIKVRQRVS